MGRKKKTKTKTKTENIEDVFEEELDLESIDVDSDDEELSEDNTDNHKADGIHSLNYDSIFKGKKNEPLKEDDFDSGDGFFNDNFEIDKSSSEYYESNDNERYVRTILLKEKIYDILSTKTNLKFIDSKGRPTTKRKPSKLLFNEYFSKLKEQLIVEKFTNVEIFMELSTYFSDNEDHMLKLLYSNHRNVIFNELGQYVGKYIANMKICHENLHVGDEIKFTYIDQYTDEENIGDGVIKNMDGDLIEVDSYDTIHKIEIEQITKIVNNIRYKNALNVVNTTDFL